jgi:hypothetical protein
MKNTNIQTILRNERKNCKIEGTVNFCITALFELCEESKTAKQIVSKFAKSKKEFREKFGTKIYETYKIDQQKTIKRKDVEITYTIKCNLDMIFNFLNKLSKESK